MHRWLIVVPLLLISLHIVAQEEITCGYEGSLLVYNQEDEALVMRDVDDPDAEAIFIAEEGRRAAWSPDGCTLAYYANRTIFFWDGDSTDFLPFEIIDLSYIEWSPDSQFVVFDAYWQGLPHVFTADAEGTEMRRWTEFGPDSTPPNPYGQSPHWSPDGSTIAYIGTNLNSGTPYDHYLYLLDVESGQFRESIALERSDFQWSFDGDAIVFIRGDAPYVLQRYDLETEEQTTLYISDEYFTLPQWTADGSRFLWERVDVPHNASYNRVEVIDPEDFSVILSFEADNPLWSPDGRSIAYHQFTYPTDGSRGSTCELFVLEGLQPPRLIDRCRVGSMAWHPSGG